MSYKKVNWTDTKDESIGTPVNANNLNKTDKAVDAVVSVLLKYGDNTIKEELLNKINLINKEYEDNL